ncbi:hypothetical protein RSAG8_12108, partial [Rhizoctonia solani AG-8 WAC10335]
MWPEGGTIAGEVSRRTRDARATERQRVTRAPETRVRLAGLVARRLLVDRDVDDSNRPLPSPRIDVFTWR